MVGSGDYLTTDSIRELEPEVRGWMEEWAKRSQYDVYRSGNELFGIWAVPHISVRVLGAHSVAFWRGGHKREKSYPSLDDAEGDINRWVLQGLP